MASDGDRSGLELVGRARECDVIDSLLASASGGESGVLVLRGEPGMGKTALLGYAASGASGMRVLRVTGVEAEHDLAFAGLHALLWPIIDELPGLPEPQRAALSAALGLAPGEGRDRFLASAGVLSLLAAASETRPTLCLVDDAQWLDVPSADALVFTARRVIGEGVVILFGAREGELRRFDAPGLDELTLTRLDPEPSATLLSHSSSQIAPAVRERLLDEAAGNPLALLELPSALSDAQLTGEAPLGTALPLTAGLRRVFTQRLERLPNDTQTALLIAAAEETGDLAIVFRAAARLNLSPERLDPAEEAGLIKTDGAVFAFRHPLVRAAVYQAASSGRIQRIHAMLAEVLGGDKHAARALWHRAMATLAPDEALASALESSARESQQRGGHASAASALERAAELSGGEFARGVRLASAAEAAWRAGQADRARGLIGRSMPLAGQPERARLLHLAGVIEGRSGWLRDGVATLQKAVAMSEDPSLQLEMLREASSLAIYSGAYDDVVALGARVGELSLTTDADRFTAAAVGCYAADIARDSVRGARLSAEAIGLAERLDDPMCLTWAAHTVARQGSAGDGLPYANRAVEIARERALMTTLPLALQAQAAGLIAESRFDLAYSTAEEGWRLARDVGDAWAASWNLGHLATIDALRGAERELRARVEELQALVTTSGALSVTSHIAWVLGLLDLGRGRPAEALERLLIPVSTIRPESNPVFVLGLPDAVEAAVRADRTGAVTDHLDRYADWVQRSPTPLRLALLARCRAIIDESDPDRHFTRAIELREALSPFDRARSRLLYGEWLRRQRRRVEARPHLRAALETFQQLGTAPWEARARSELRASGETARKRDPSMRDQLTAQELQISRLVAGGKSNPEVAAQLFLSPRTIDYHLRKVFTKLDIASRGELAAADLGEPAAV